MRYKGNLISKFSGNDAHIQDIDFSLMDLSDDDFNNIFQAIKTNTHVFFINFLETGMTEKHIELLHDSILQNETLTQLKIPKYMDYSPGTLDFIDKIMSHIKKNQSRSYGDSELCILSKNF